MANNSSDNHEAWDFERELPNAARMYDYYLGGVSNLAIDRQAADELIERLPDMPLVARENRAFLRRAVRGLIGAGVEQFVDLGSGLPTVGNVHDVAQSLNPRARVMYVDNDATAVKYAKHLLADRAGVGAVQADLRDPAAVLGSAAVRDLLDLDRPVAILMLAVLHFVSDTDDPAGILAAYHAQVAPGSYLALSHGTGDARDPAQVQAGRTVYDRTATPVTPRSWSEVKQLFAGWELLPPGLVWAPQWRPDTDPDQRAGSAVVRPERSGMWVGVARRDVYPPAAPHVTDRPQ